MEISDGIEETEGARFTRRPELRLSSSRRNASNQGCLWHPRSSMDFSLLIALFHAFFAGDSSFTSLFYSCAEWLPVAPRVEAELHLPLAQFVSHQSIL